MTNYMSLTDNPPAPLQYWNPSRTCYVAAPHFPFKLLSSVWFMSGASVFTGCTTDSKHDSSSSVSSRRQPQRHHVTRHPESTSDNHGNGTAALAEISSKSLSDLQLPQGKHWNIIGPPQSHGADAVPYCYTGFIPAWSYFYYLLAGITAFAAMHLCVRITWAPDLDSDTRQYKWQKKKNWATCEIWEN